MSQGRFGFAVFDANGHCQWDAVGQRLGADVPPLSEVMFDLRELAESAGLFFRGYYPFEAPYHSWGEMIPLGWQEEYWHETAEGSTMRQQIGEQIERILRALAPELIMRSSESMPAYTYLMGSQCESSKSTVQGLAVEALWWIDRCLQDLAEPCLPAAMRSQALAYQNLFECSCQAQEILGFASKNARTAALARHRENHAMRDEVWRWYEKNRDAFKSMDAAAAAVAGHIVPVTFRTAREWIGACEKRLRSARRP